MLGAGGEAAAAGADGAGAAASCLHARWGKTHQLGLHPSVPTCTHLHPPTCTHLMQTCSTTSGPWWEDCV